MGRRFFYIKDGTLIYYDNLAGVERYVVPAGEKLPIGQVALKAVYKSDADKPFAGATVTLFANDKKIGEGVIMKSIPNRVTLDETLDVGFDTGTPVSEDYQVPFRFTGQLKGVTIDLN
jgi:arylsulfatase